MKVIESHYGNKYDMTTDQLIRFSVMESTTDDRVELLEERINHLIQVVANLINRSHLSDEEILSITGAGMNRNLTVDDGTIN